MSTSISIVPIQPVLRKYSYILIRSHNHAPDRIRVTGFFPVLGPAKKKFSLDSICPFPSISLQAVIHTVGIIALKARNAIDLILEINGPASQNLLSALTT